MRDHRHLLLLPVQESGRVCDGGMMVTQDQDLFDRLMKLRTHGSVKTYFHDEVGFNSRLDALQAAVLRAKLPFLAEWSAKRRENAKFYDAAFADIGEIVTPYALEISWLFTSLRNIFVDNRLIDSSSKFEFYGRLEIAANLSIHAGQKDLVHIAQAILEAAELMLKEMSEKRFYSLSVSRGTGIAADHGTQ